MGKVSNTLLLAILGSLCVPSRQDFPFRNTSLPFDERVKVSYDAAVQLWRMHAV